MQHTKKVRTKARKPRAREPKPKQLTFSKRGGARRGAGRKPKGEKAMVAHAKRGVLDARHPVHVTMKLRAGLPSLRQEKELECLQEAFRAASDRSGMRLAQFSVQSNHFHFLVEATHTESLSRGMQGLAVRIAKKLNRLWNRRGSVFADRFHAHVLYTSRAVRNALAYVLHNARKHGIAVIGIDGYTSGAAFDGWKDARVMSIGPPPPVAPPRTKLLRSAWKRCGLISIHEVPGGSRVKAQRSSAASTPTRARANRSATARKSEGK
jgi:REP element-mobilizing transposase RayT